MGLFPQSTLEPLVTIMPWSRESLGNALFVGNTQSMNGAASATFPAANRALFYPFFLSKTVIAKMMFTLNGAAVSGNIDVGIYSNDGRRIVSIGTTAQAGTSAIQTYDITDTQLAPGQYYLAIAMDNATGTLMRGNIGAVARCQAVGMAQMASAFVLPATATLATIASDYVPIFGLSVQAFV